MSEAEEEEEGEIRSGADIVPDNAQMQGLEHFLGEASLTEPGKTVSKFLNKEKTHS